MSTTASDLIEWQDAHYPMSTNIDDYEFRRLGRKDYGVFHKPDQGTWGGMRIVARYACSHLEARRRLAMLLITRRLSK